MANEFLTPLPSLFNERAASYKNESQIARILTEPWVKEHAYCPSCGSNLEQFPNGYPVADFHCLNCGEQYELKSKSGAFGSSVVDGAYFKMLERLNSISNPSLFLLSYASSNLLVTSLVVIPKFFFIPRIIQKRNPLAPTARRAGWIGCNIKIGEIPNTGKISLIEAGVKLNKGDVLQQWSNTSFLSRAQTTEKRSWIIDTLECIEKIGKKKFTLADVYKFENTLSERHPDNGHIRDKIRQQLQVLRDRGVIHFLGNGIYQFVN
jgi:type II restriction enzyme